MEAHQKAEVVEVASKSLEEAVSKVKAKLAKVKTDWAWERERVELDLTNAKKGAIEVVEKFKASKCFEAEKAQAVAGL